MDTSRIEAAQAKAAELAAAQNETLTLVREIWDERKAFEAQAREARNTIVSLLPMLRETFSTQQIADALGCSTNAVNNLQAAGRDAADGGKAKAKPAKKANVVAE